MSLGTGSLIGPYEVLTQLGVGGMGVVHLAKTATASLVALKVIKSELAGDAQMRQRFMDEVGSLRMVYGARIARFEGADLDHDPPWLAIQYVPGPTLREHVEQRGIIPSELGAILGAVLAEGLVAIHKAGLIHRDLKPHNVIMAEDGPIIIDLGLAQLTDRGDHLTETGVAVGTPAYMPPEQVRGEKVDGKADVYALGATLVFALTGHHLYTADNRYAMAQQIADPATHPDLLGVPGTLAGLVGSMVAQDPVQRPSAAQAMDAFVNVLRGAGQDATAVRTQLAAATFVRPILHLPDDVDDPVQDPEDPNATDLGDGPTDPVAGPRPAEPKAMPEPPRVRQPVNVDWLVASLRDRYAKGADL